MYFKKQALLRLAWNLTFAPYTIGKGEDEVVEELAEAHNTEPHAETHQTWSTSVKRSDDNDDHSLLQPKSCFTSEKSESEVEKKETHRQHLIWSWSSWFPDRAETMKQKGP